MWDSRAEGEVEGVNWDQTPNWEEQEQRNKEKKRRMERKLFSIFVAMKIDSEKKAFKKKKKLINWKIKCNETKKFTEIFQ